MNETCKFINEFFGLTQVKEPNKKMSIKSSDKKNQTQQKPNEKVDYLNASFVEENYEEYSRESLINRTYSKKHIDIRQSYFDKASEAHKRGWGAVAQYYAECVCYFPYFKLINVFYLFFSINLGTPRNN